MTRPRRLLAGVALGLALVALAPPAPTVGRIVLDFDLQTPRAFGYLIGDVVSTRVRFHLAEPYRLVEDNLPEARRISRWLVLDTPRLEAEQTLQGTRYELRLDYRVVGAPNTVTYLHTPALSLDVASDLGSLALAVPAWRFSVGPLVVSEEPVPGAAVTLQPPQPPPPLPTRAGWVGAGLMTAAALVVLGFLAWLHLRIPWLARSNGPFARAARDLRRLARERDPAEARRRALARLHRAFDETAGHALFEGELASFFARHRGFGRLREPIAVLFAESRVLFYLPDGERAAATLDLPALRRLCLACRDVERGAC